MGFFVRILRCPSGRISDCHSIDSEIQVLPLSLMGLYSSAAYHIKMAYLARLSGVALSTHRLFLVLPLTVSTSHRGSSLHHITLNTEQ